ncbi:MAG: myosin heavy subunit [Planctomycetota bacterium]|jgi:myosin heavy subunit
MSPIGRIFIVLNLILAAAFLSFAAHNVATSHDFKAQLTDETTAHAATKADLDAQVGQLRADLDTKSTEADTFRSDLDDSKAEVERKTADNTDLERQVREANQVNERTAGAISDIQGTLGQIETAKDEAVSARREAENERDDALSSAQDATTRSEELEASNSGLEKRITDLQVELVAASANSDQLETQLATLVDVTGVSYKDIAVQEQIDASVLQVLYDVKPGILSLNKGSKDGVLRGYTFEIYDGINYKGQARVENVREDMCTLLILRTEQGQTIKAGDKASTRL